VSYQQVRFGPGIVRLRDDGTMKFTAGRNRRCTLDDVAAAHLDGETGKRVTVTRLALVGVFALAAPKRTGGEYLTVILADGTAYTGKVHPSDGGRARALLAAIEAHQITTGRAAEQEVVG
jgi:hypothetical protein